MGVSLKKKVGVCVVLFLFALFAMKKIAFSNNEMQPQIAEKILRFHVIANSDSKADQSVKIKVRDGVLEYLEPLFNDCKTKSDCEKIVKENTDNIKAKANEILANEGFLETASVSLKKRYFPVKQYGEYTFPEGEYEALCIEIGQAEGKNWWCVLYPKLCFIDSLYVVVPEESENQLKKVLTEEEYNSVFSDRESKIVVKSKIGELIKKTFG